MKYLRRIIFLLIIIFCLLFIIRFPLNEYEWMLKEDPSLTIESLPVDNEASMNPWLAISPITLLFLCILFARSINERKVLVLSGGILLCIWAYRFRTILFN
jgi:hypothetical protein